MENITYTLNLYIKLIKKKSSSRRAKHKCLRERDLLARRGEEKWGDVNLQQGFVSRRSEREEKVTAPEEESARLFNGL